MCHRGVLLRPADERIHDGRLHQCAPRRARGSSFQVLHYTRGNLISILIRAKAEHFEVEVHCLDEFQITLLFYCQSSRADLTAYDELCIDRGPETAMSPTAFGRVFSEVVHDKHRSTRLITDISDIAKDCRHIGSILISPSKNQGQVVDGNDHNPHTRVRLKPPDHFHYFGGVLAIAK